MVKQMSRLGSEMLLIVGILIALKNGFFPWIISVWYPDPQLAEQMGEWTAIIVGVGTCLIYMGFGSAAKYAHSLTLAQMVGAFGLSHLLFFLPLPAWLSPIDRDWQGLVHDLLALFLPERVFTSAELFCLLLSLFLLGRLFHVREEETNQTGGFHKQREKNLPSSSL